MIPDMKGMILREMLYYYWMKIESQEKLKIK